MIFNSVNPHALQNIAELSQKNELEASEDIFDDSGHKLWAKGSKVSGDLLEKLLRRKLARPLEASLTVEGALSFPVIINDCKGYLERNPLFARILTRDALALIANLKGFALPEPMRLLLTTSHANGGPNYERALGTMLVSAGIAARLGASDDEARRLLVAALLHDLGEMYVNPEYLKGAYRLEPHDWRHVAIHPRIGQLLIEELTSLPPSVGVCIAQHHERLDGSGYPNQVDKSKFLRIGGWLAVADSVAAILARGDAGAPLRAALALRIVPEEFDHEAVNAVIQHLQKGTDTYGGVANASVFEVVRKVGGRLKGALEIAETMEEGASDPFVRKTIDATRLLLGNLAKSLRATGAEELESMGAEAVDNELLAEISVITREVEWRMRNLARNVHIRAEGHEKGSSLPVLEPLIAALNS